MADADDSDSAHASTDSAESTRPTPVTSRPDDSLVSRTLLTWIELTIVGIVGGALGTTVGGPVGFLIYLATTLLSVGVIFFNVNELIEDRLDSTDGDR